MNIRYLLKSIHFILVIYRFYGRNHCSLSPSTHHLAWYITYYFNSGFFWNWCPYFFLRYISTISPIFSFPRVFNLPIYYIIVCFDSRKNNSGRWLNNKTRRLRWKGFVQMTLIMIWRWRVIVWIMLGTPIVILCKIKIIRILPFCKWIVGTEEDINPIILKS